eukprot:g7486.t1
MKTAGAVFGHVVDDSDAQTEAVVCHPSAADLCVVCRKNAFKYTCPGCDRKTCSLPCSMKHKYAFKCSGMREKVELDLNIKQMTKKTLLKDFQFLDALNEELNRDQRCREALEDELKMKPTLTEADKKKLKKKQAAAKKKMHKATAAAANGAGAANEGVLSGKTGEVEEGDADEDDADPKPTDEVDHNADETLLADADDAAGAAALAETEVVLVDEENNATAATKPTPTASVSGAVGGAEKSSAQSTAAAAAAAALDNPDFRIFNYAYRDTGLQLEAKKRRTRLLLADIALETAKKNNSYFDKRTGKIHWRLEWTFFGKNGRKEVYQDEPVCEDVTVTELLERFLQVPAGYEAGEAVGGTGTPFTSGGEDDMSPTVDAGAERAESAGGERLDEVDEELQGPDAKKRKISSEHAANANAEAGADPSPGEDFDFNYEDDMDRFFRDIAAGKLRVYMRDRFPFANPNVTSWTARHKEVSLIEILPDRSVKESLHGREVAEYPRFLVTSAEIEPSWLLFTEMEKKRADFRDGFQVGDIVLAQKEIMYPPAGSGDADDEQHQLLGAPRIVPEGSEGVIEDLDEDGHWIDWTDLEGFDELVLMKVETVKRKVIVAKSKQAGGGDGKGATGGNNGKGGKSNNMQMKGGKGKMGMGKMGKKGGFKGGFGKKGGGKDGFTGGKDGAAPGENPNAIAIGEAGENGAVGGFVGGTGGVEKGAGKKGKKGKKGGKDKNNSGSFQKGGGFNSSGKKGGFFGGSGGKFGKPQHVPQAQHQYQNQDAAAPAPASAWPQEQQYGGGMSGGKGDDSFFQQQMMQMGMQMQNLQQNMLSMHSMWQQNQNQNHTGGPPGQQQQQQQPMQLPANAGGNNAAQMIPAAQHAGTPGSIAASSNSNLQHGSLSGSTLNHASTGSLHTAVVHVSQTPQIVHQQQQSPAGAQQQHQLGAPQQQPMQQQQQPMTSAAAPPPQSSQPVAAPPASAQQYYSNAAPGGASAPTASTAPSSAAVMPPPAGVVQQQISQQAPQQSVAESITPPSRSDIETTPSKLATTTGVLPVTSSFQQLAQYQQNAPIRANHSINNVGTITSSNTTSTGATSAGAPQQQGGTSTSTSQINIPPLPNQHSNTTLLSAGPASSATTPTPNHAVAMYPAQLVQPQQILGAVGVASMNPVLTGHVVGGVPSAAGGGGGAGGGPSTGHATPVYQQVGGGVLGQQQAGGATGSTAVGGAGNTPPAANAVLVPGTAQFPHQQQGLQQGQLPSAISNHQLQQSLNRLQQQLQQIQNSQLNQQNQNPSTPQTPTGGGGTNADSLSSRQAAGAAAINAPLNYNAGGGAGFALVQLPLPSAGVLAPASSSSGTTPTAAAAPAPPVFRRFAVEHNNRRRLFRCSLTDSSEDVLDTVKQAFGLFHVLGPRARVRLLLAQSRETLCSFRVDGLQDGETYQLLIFDPDGNLQHQRGISGPIAQRMAVAAGQDRPPPLMEASKAHQVREADIPSRMEPVREPAAGHGESQSNFRPVEREPSQKEKRKTTRRQDTSEQVQDQQEGIISLSAKDVDDNSEDAELERSPDGRYIRYRGEPRGGAGVFNRVNLGYDSNTGRQITWNILDHIPQNKDVAADARRESDWVVHGLASWELPATSQFVVITSRGSSHTIRSHITRLPKDRPLKLAVVRKWTRDLASGLQFFLTLYRKHGAVFIDNVFVKQNTGNLFLGDPSFGKTPLSTAAEKILAKTSSDKRDLVGYGLTVLEIIFKGQLDFDKLQRCLEQASGPDGGDAGKIESPPSKESVPGAAPGAKGGDDSVEDKDQVEVLSSKSRSEKEEKLTRRQDSASSTFSSQQQDQSHYPAPADSSVVDRIQHESLKQVVRMCLNPAGWASLAQTGSKLTISDVLAQSFFSEPDENEVFCEVGTLGTPL